MEGQFITVIAYLFGEQKKHLDGVVSIENPHDTTLRATIAKAIKQEKPQLPFKDSDYVCGDKCPVWPFATKQSVKCGQFVDSMYYGYAKGKGRDKVKIICCFCSNDEDLVAEVEVREKMNTTQSPLPICRDCFDRSIFPPVIKAKTNFVMTAAMSKKRKETQLAAVVANNQRKDRKKSSMV